MATFQATSRIPTRPLSYENVSMAKNREVIIDYSTGDIYVKDNDGNIHSVSEAIKDYITETIIEDSSFITEAMKITITNPSTGEEETYLIDELLSSVVQDVYTASTSITAIQSDVSAINGTIAYEILPAVTVATETAATVTTMQAQVATLETATESLTESMEVLDDIMGDEGGITITPDSLELDDDHQFIDEEQAAAIETIVNKVEIATYEVAIADTSWIGDEAPFSTTITGLDWATADMLPPTMDIVCSDYYATAQEELESYMIYRGVTADRSITLYNNVKPTITLNVLFEVKTTGTVTVTE